MKKSYIKPEIQVQAVVLEQGIAAGSTIDQNLELWNRGYCRECRFRTREVCSAKCAWCNHTLEYN